jgi:hypothetical protein
MARMHIPTLEKSPVLPAIPASPKFLARPKPLTRIKPLRMLGTRGAVSQKKAETPAVPVTTLSPSLSSAAIPGGYRRVARRERRCPCSHH